MNASFTEKHAKLAVLSGMLVAMFSLSAPAALYTFPYTDSGAIPQGGTTFSVEHTVSTSPDYIINSVELLLTFNNSYDLNGNINGTLILDPSGSDTFVSFSPVATSSGTGSQEIYDVTFSDFNSLNPNNLWALNLWDNNNSGIENGLVSWTLEITAVPEPVNMALAIFGVVAVGGIAARRWLASRKNALQSEFNALINSQKGERLS